MFTYQRYFKWKLKPLDIVHTSSLLISSILEMPCLSDFRDYCYSLYSKLVNVEFCCLYCNCEGVLVTPKIDYKQGPFLVQTF